MNPTIAGFWSDIRSAIATTAIDSFNAHRNAREWHEGDCAAIRQIGRFDFVVGFDLYPQEFRDSDIACLLWDDGYCATEQCAVAREAAIVELDKYFALSMAN